MSHDEAAATATPLQQQHADGHDDGNGRDPLAPASSSPSAPSSVLSSIVQSVKRNSVSLSNALSSATHSSGASDHEIAGLKAQHANELSERDEQSAALKMNMAHLHKKTLDLEKQNATLMTHLSNLEEERHSLAEKREKELKRRQAREAAKAAAKEAGLSEAFADDEDEDDIEIARQKWAAVRAALETKLATAVAETAAAKSEVASRDEKISALTIKVSDEEKNFERILSKMSEKDEELMRLREEVHNKNSAIHAMKQQQQQGAAHNPSASPPAQNQQITSPSKAAPASSGGLRGFFSSKTAPTKPANSPTSPPPPTQQQQQQPPQPSPQPAAQQQQPSPSPAQPLSVAPPPQLNTEDAEPAAASTNAADSSAAAGAAPAAVPASSPPAPTFGAPLSPNTPSSPSSKAAPAPWSTAQPLEAQVASLQSELSASRIMNEHLIGSIQKKDAVISRVQDEGERIMSKLAEKEMLIMNLRETAASQDELVRENKKQQQTIQKLQQQMQTATTQAAAASAAQQAQSNSAAAAAAAAELKQAMDAIAMVHAEFDQLKGTLEDTKDQLFLAETQLIDKQKLLGEQSDLIRDLRASAESHEITITNLMRSKERSEREMNEHVDYLERKCLSEIQEWERKYDADTEEAQRKHTEVLEVLAAARRELAESKRSEGQMIEQMEQMKSTYTTLQSSEAALKEQVQSLTHHLSELNATSVIETRKRNHLVLELKNALKLELIKSKENAAKLKMAEDDIVTLKVMNQHSIAATQASTATLTVDTETKAEAGEAAGASARGQPPMHAASMSNLHAPASAPSPSPAHSKGVEQEVTMALAQKLAQLQNEKHSLQKRTQGLEEHVEMLQSDVLQKKEMIRNLVRRIETGALSTNDNDGMQKTQMFSSLTIEGRQALFEKMEMILQETTLQNAQYKNNLQSMGGEITKLMAELDEKSAELTSAREELDGAKDEQELAQQAADDSAALLRSTDAQLKKLERASAALVSELEYRDLLDQVLAQVEAELAAAIRQAAANSLGARTAPPTPAPAAAPAAAAAKSRTAGSPPNVKVAVAAAAVPASDSASAAATSAAASASPADARGSELEASRQRAAEEEEQRRAALLADADAISAQYADGRPADSLTPPLNARSAPQLIADPPAADEDESAFRQDNDRSYLQDGTRTDD